MFRPSFIVVGKDGKFSIAYFGEDTAKASELYEALTVDPSVDSVQMYRLPVASLTCNPKELMAYYAAEEAKNKADADAIANKDRIEAERKIDEAREQIAEAKEVLKALKVSE